jgi:hypothetical protein
MKRLALLAACGLLACGPKPRPIDPTLLHPPRVLNDGPSTAAPLFQGQSVSGILTCEDKLYYRLDGLSEGTRIRVRLHVETGSPFRFCHQAAFPDAHDQYSYTDLLGCAGENAPSDVSTEAVSEGATLYVRIWRNGPPDPACIATRFTLTADGV